VFSEHFVPENRMTNHNTEEMGITDTAETSTKINASDLRPQLLYENEDRKC
jgi:hypothetical protein